MKEFLQLQRDIPGVSPETVFMLGNYPIANTTIMTIVILLVVLLFSIYISRITRLSPSRIQNFFEYLYDLMGNFIQTLTGEGKYKDYLFPLIASIFIYLGLANFITFIPGLANFTFDGIPILRTATSDFNTTFGLALAMVLLTQWASIRKFGIFSHLGKYIKLKEIYQGFRKGIGAGIFALVEFFVGLLDIIGEIAKIISLSLRLFGNIYAGEVLALIILGAFSFAIPATWMGLNMFFALVQALVFGALVAAYYMLAIEGGDESSEK